MKMRSMYSNMTLKTSSYDSGAGYELQRLQERIKSNNQASNEKRTRNTINKEKEIEERGNEPGFRGGSRGG